MENKREVELLEKIEIMVYPDGLGQHEGLECIKLIQDYGMNQAVLFGNWLIKNTHSKIEPNKWFMDEEDRRIWRSYSTQELYPLFLEHL